MFCITFLKESWEQVYPSTTPPCFVNKTKTKMAAYGAVTFSVVV